MIRIRKPETRKDFGIVAVEIYRKLEDFPPALQGGALTIGNFDGVHRGHAELISRLRGLADDVDGPAVVFTFDPHPVRILRPQQAPPPLTWTYRKAELLSGLGVDAMIAYPTDQALLDLDYREFFEQIVCGQIQARAMVEGPNFFFGRNREGNVERLEGLCRERQVQLKIVEPAKADANLISSSRIRQLIREGLVDQAREFLTQPYRIRGMVTHGAARGKQIGFPTANLDAIDTLIPALGVYAGRAIVDNQTYWAAIHIGPNPTFQEHNVKVEVHILDFEGALYGQVLEVDFVSRIRGIHQFDSKDDLIKQLQSDIGQTRNLSKLY